MTDIETPPNPNSSTDEYSEEVMALESYNSKREVKKRFILLNAIMAFSCIVVLAISYLVLYSHQLNEYREVLQVSAQSQARLIEAIAKASALFSDSTEMTAISLDIIRDAHNEYAGFGRTGEFTMGSLKDDSIFFVLRHRLDEVDQPVPIAFNSDLAEPMRRALLGESGTIVGLDYRGVTVLAAHEPVEILNMGIVTKIDLSEIRAPLIRAGLIAMSFALMTVLLSTLIFFRVSSPLVKQLTSYARVLEKHILMGRQAEADRIELEDRLLQSQKMEAIGQLTGGIAHDFNNILQAILGYGEIVQSGIDEDSFMKECIDQIMISGLRAKTLVSQLLSFSRQQVLRLEYLDINKTIQDLLEMIRPIIGEHISLEVIPGHSLGIVYADRAQIGQILTNLCINAMDSMPDGGKIVIETENVILDVDYCRAHSSTQPGKHILLSVSDSGCGMDEETVSQIFTPFFTTKEVGKGTGLGLSTVYGLVKQHEGVIEVYSEPGKGTLFKIYLPVVENNTSSLVDAIEQPVVGGTETILIAEDDPNISALCSRILIEAGYTIITAVNGEEAIEHLKEKGKAVHLALLDVVMPELGGKGVNDFIEKEFPHIKVLFSSGYSSNAIHNNFVLDTDLYLIQKPYKKSSLLRTIRELLDYQ